jgi:ComF family protein
MKQWLTTLTRSALRTGIKTGIDDLCAALYPSLCWLCRARPCVDGLGCAEHALAPCRFDPDVPRCAGCAERLPEGIPSGVCARCRREPRGYRQLVAGGAYREETPLRDWILAFKHGGRRELARPLAAFLAASWERAGGPPPGALLTSVPLHPLRRFERGYDQARLLAEELADLLGLAHVPALCRRRWTPPQGAPGASSRAANVARAFEVLPRQTERLAGRAVWLVDDVVTSGATARACAEVLRRALASEVSVLALARVELDGRPEGASGNSQGEGPAGFRVTPVATT